VNDTSWAFSKAVAALVALAPTSRTNDQGMIDLGGAALDLKGGIYLISSPVVLPPGYANFKLRSGSLVAGSAFPPDRYMVEVGGSCSGGGTTPGVSAKNCNTDVDIESLTLDGRATAFGGLLVNHTMNVNVGPALMIYGWRGVGISLQGSGAGYIHSSWLGEIPPGSKIPRNSAQGTAILMDGGQHDCMVEDVIVWSGKVGVNSSNGANRLEGVHTWNLAGAAGGVGILLHTGSGRVQNCYLDYAPLVIRQPSDVLVTDNFFLGSSTIVLESPAPNWKWKGSIRDMVITSNQFRTGNTPNTTFVLDETGSPFTGLIDVVVENNEISKSRGPAGKLGTRATKTVALPAGASNATIWFSTALLFSGMTVGIAEESVQCWMAGTFATAVAGSVVSGENAVQVVLAEPVPADQKQQATVSCSVDQSIRAFSAH